MAKVWPLDQLSREYELERRCWAHGWLEERVGETVSKLCEARCVGRIGEDSQPTLAS